MIISAGMLLTIVFIVLKAIGLVGFSWWWVFSPWIFTTSGMILFGAIKAMFTVEKVEKDKKKGQ